MLDNEREISARKYCKYGTELQIVGTPAPMTHNFSKWHVTVKVYAPGWRVIKKKTNKKTYRRTSIILYH